MKFRQSQPATKFTDVIAQQKAARSHVYFKSINELKKPMNEVLRKETNEAVNLAAKSNDSKLRAKIFILDHTAEVLENFRRLQEYNIWKKELHYEREKLVALKKESRKLQNVIENYDALYGTRGYLEDTKNEHEYYKHTMSDFIENIRLRDKERKVLAVTDPDALEEANFKVDNLEYEEKLHNLFPKMEEDRERYEAFKQAQTAEPTPYNEYQGKIKELKNMRIRNFLQDRSHNKELQKYLESKEEEEESQLLIEDENSSEIIEIGKLLS